MTTRRQQSITHTILAWYAANGRHDLPWRHTKDPYHITVAEIMLQQTNVPKVIEKYTLFLKLFPSWAELAAAPQGAVVRAWQGLGYNRRALYLHRAAKGIVARFDGAVPRDPDVLGTLPGMGPYTRNAVLIFAFNEDRSACDVNIARVIRRWHGKAMWPSVRMQNEEVARWVPQGTSYQWHSALMDFASLICTAKNPQCAVCPVKNLCASYPAPRDQLTVKRPEPSRREEGKTIPRRIWRGRIVEALRHAAVTTDELGRAIKTDWENTDAAWLEGVLALLVRDGMIENRNGAWRLRDE